ncbi:unnamed protein product, partial [Amoebophrya sp. A25]
GKNRDEIDPFTTWTMWKPPADNSDLLNWGSFRRFVASKLTERISERASAFGCHNCAG